MKTPKLCVILCGAFATIGCGPNGPDDAGLPKPGTWHVTRTATFPGCPDLEPVEENGVEFQCDDAGGLVIPAACDSRPKDGRIDQTCTFSLEFGSCTVVTTFHREGTYTETSYDVIDTVTYAYEGDCSNWLGDPCPEGEVSHEIGEWIGPECDGEETSFEDRIVRRLTRRGTTHE